MGEPTDGGQPAQGRREPIFKIPGALVAVMAVLVAIHALRQIIPDAWDDILLKRLAFEPATLTFLFDPDRVIGALQRLAAQGESGFDQASFGRGMLQNYGAQPWTLLTYGLLHANWVHVGLNLLWLLAFGAPVARRLGPSRLFSFLAGGTLAGALAHWLTHQTDMMPVIGASAAVSACMGAALRFVFQPQRPATGLTTPAGTDSDAIHRRPSLRLGQVLRDRRALSFLVVWFVSNLLFAVGSLSTELAGGPVAWEAHIGGFLFGLFALPLFDPPQVRAATAATPQPDGL